MAYRKVQKNDKAPADTKIYDSINDLSGWIEQGGRVGWIINEGYVAIDVDDTQDSVTLKQILDYEGIKCRIHTTERGKHFIFKVGDKPIKQGANKHTPIGLRVDTRVAHKGYIILPLNDEHRTIEADVPLKDVDKIPHWLAALNINNNMDDYVYNGMAEARNDGLNRQVGRLKASGMNPDEIKKTALLINKFLFAEPLDITELEATVLREENLTLKADDEKLNHYVMAKKLEELFDIKYISSEFYIYNDGYYAQAIDILNQTMVKICPTFTKKQRTETLDYLAIQHKCMDNDLNDYTINTINGVYNLKEKLLLPHSPDIATRNRVNFEYVDDTKKNMAIENFLLDIANGDAERKRLILEMIGYCLTRSIREQKMFFLYGETAGNGKSTLLEVMTALISKRNVSNLPLEKIHSDSFSAPELDNMLVNVFDDISQKFLNDVSTVKAIVTGGEMTVARKFGHPFRLKPFCKLVFATNGVPKAPKDEGWYRRITIIPFLNKFDDKEDNFDKEALFMPDALNWLGTRAVQAYQRVFKQPPNKAEKWANWKETYRYLQIYKEENDSALAFFNQLGISKLKKTKHPKTGEALYSKNDLFNKYKLFVEENGLKEKSNIMFSKTIRQFWQDIVWNNAHYWVVKTRGEMNMEDKDD